MSEYGAVIGWTGVRTGRERKAIEVWGETLAFYDKAATDGRIESVEPIGFPGGLRGLIGGLVIRGDETQIETFVASQDFMEHFARGSLVAEELTVARCNFGSQTASTVGNYFAQLDALGI